MDNDTVSGDIQHLEREVHELVYVVASLLVATLSALVASFLGLRHRRHHRHDSTSPPPVYRARCRAVGLGQDEIRV